jgi:hypothetical protein
MTTALAVSEFFVSDEHPMYVQRWGDPTSFSSSTAARLRNRPDQHRDDGSLELSMLAILRR